MWKTILGLLILSVAYTQAQKAVAVLRNGNVDGVVTFEQNGASVIVRGTISGLSEGEHGFHIHAKGDVSDPKCVSAGGHFNPYNKPHGDISAQERHVGDLGNIKANSSGIAVINIEDHFISLTNTETCIFGRAVVVHADRDDLGLGGFSDSKTTGHAGARLACGVVGIV